MRLRPVDGVMHPAAGLLHAHAAPLGLGEPGGESPQCPFERETGPLSRLAAALTAGVCSRTDTAWPCARRADRTAGGAQGRAAHLRQESLLREHFRDVWRQNHVPARPERRPNC